MRKRCFDTILSIIEPNYPIKVNYSNFGKYKDLIECVIEAASKNGLEYLVSNKLEEKGIETNEIDLKDLDKLKNTIKLLNIVSKESGIDYILIKDCNTVPHIPRDVDIFIRQNDKDKMISALKKHSLQLECSNIIETTVSGDDTLPLDVYTKIIYFDHEFLDEKFLFDSVEKREFFGIEYPGLNYEAEFLLTLLHGLFGHRRLTLLDFIHLKRIKEKNPNRNLCCDYAKKNNWDKSFSIMNRKFSEIQKNILEGHLNNFPYLFDINFVMECIEAVDSINLSNKDKILIIYSLFLDGLKLKVENSPLNDTIKKHEWLRKTLLNIAYTSRTMRKDKYS